jgi:hypothetical protein
MATSRSSSLEGSVDIFLKDDHSAPSAPSHAGDMLIMKPDAKLIPMPSSGGSGTPATDVEADGPQRVCSPREREVTCRGRLQGQGRKMKKGELHKTAFLIPGRGTRVNLPNEIRRELARFGIRDREGRAPGDLGVPVALVGPALLGLHTRRASPAPRWSRRIHKPRDEPPHLDRRSIPSARWAGLRGPFTGRKQWRRCLLTSSSFGKECDVYGDRYAGMQNKGESLGGLSV